MPFLLPNQQRQSTEGGYLSNIIMACDVALEYENCHYPQTTFDVMEHLKLGHFVGFLDELCHSNRMDLSLS